MTSDFSSIAEDASCYIKYCLDGYEESSFYQWGIELKDISATHDINNPNSGKIMAKNGIKYEGTLRQSARNNQGIVDSARYSILKCDYENS